MTAQALIGQITAWLKTGILLALLVLLAVVLLRAYGVQVPLRGLGHVELAYLAGAFWLVK